MPKRYNTPHRSRVVKTRLSEDEYADFTARLAPYGISQSEFLRQAIRRTAIRPVIHVSAVNDELLSAVGKLTAEYGKIGGNLNQIARYLNEYGAPYNALSGEVRAAIADLAALDLLTAGVLSNLRQVTEYAAKHESRFVKLLIQQNEIGGKRKTAAATKQLEQAQERISEVSRIIKRLYEDNVNGKISDERFMELSADYEQEQRELKDRAAALQAELDKSQAATVNAEKFMGIVRKHLAFEELTPTLLREMIEKIVVHECSYDENGTRRQDIEIYYSFVGKIDLPE